MSREALKARWISISHVAQMIILFVIIFLYCAGIIGEVAILPLWVGVIALFYGVYIIRFKEERKRK